MCHSLLRPKQDCSDPSVLGSGFAVFLRESRAELGSLITYEKLWHKDFCTGSLIWVAENSKIQKLTIIRGQIAQKEEERKATRGREKERMERK